MALGRSRGRYVHEPVQAAAGMLGGVGARGRNGEAVRNEVLEWWWRVGVQLKWKRLKYGG